MLTFDELLTGHVVVVILRGQAPERAVDLAEEVWRAGAGIVEIPVQDETGFAALSAVAQAGRRSGHMVGAGTVLTVDQVRGARAAGAAFTVAPGLCAEVVAASHEAGMPHLPGVGTATELQRALSYGCAWVKAFPASALGTAWFREMRGPFPGVNFVGSAATRPGGLAAIVAALDAAPA
jgi:2-dehydro-3-deoxyphosphogluconate aldolase/(4S)-4-hydroxy-2-oxoglutarate aldolase